MLKIRWLGIFSITTLWYIKIDLRYCIISKNILLLSVLITSDRPTSFDITDRYPIFLSNHPIGPISFRKPLNQSFRIASGLLFTCVPFLPFIGPQLPDYDLIFSWRTEKRWWFLAIDGNVFENINYWISVRMWLREAGALRWDVR